MKINNTKRKTVGKTNRQSTENHDLDMQYSFRTIPISQAMVDRMIDDLEKWPETNPESCFISEFWRAKGISESTYYTLLKRHPRLKEVHVETLRRLGQKLMYKSFKREYSWQPVHFLIQQYGTEFKEAAEFHNKDTSQQTGAIKVEMVTMPSSDLVKPKQESE